MLWVHTNQTSVLPVEAVGDRRMHTDPERVGKIQWMPDNAKRKPPKNGWSSHDGRVLHISGNMALLFNATQSYILCYSLNEYMKTTMMFLMMTSSYSYMIQMLGSVLVLWLIPAVMKSTELIEMHTKKST